MKTKELIKRLQEADPSGEVEVCVGNEDILFVAKAPAYYDGCFQVLKRDPSLEPYYNVCGVEIRGSGEKLVIHPHGLEWALVDNPEMPVSFDGEYSNKHWQDKVNSLREEYRKLHSETESKK